MATFLDATVRRLRLPRIAFPKPPATNPDPLAALERLWRDEWEVARAAYRVSHRVEDRERVSRALTALRALAQGDLPPCDDAHW